MKTKLLALILAVSLIVGLLAGCGSKAPATSEPGVVDTSKEVNLVMYVISDRPAGQDIVDENLNKILKEKMNTTLTINWIPWSDYANKYALLFSSGEVFDLVYTSSWVNFTSLAQKGAFMSLDELWPTYAPNNFAKTTAEAKMQATVDGHYYCIPSQLATYRAYGAMYRADLMEGSDWSGKMETWEDIEAYLDIVKANHPGIDPLDIYSSGSEVDDMWIFSNGYNPSKGSTNDFLFYDMSSDSPKLETYYEIESIPAFLEMMNRWNEKGFFSKSALADTDSSKMTNGKAALKFHNIDTYSGTYIQHPDWGFQYAPMNKYMAHLPFTQDSVSISTTSKNPERAMAFWELLTSDQEVYDAFMYGVLGTSYVLNEAGQFRITDPSTYATSAMWAARTTGLNRDADGTPEAYGQWHAVFEEQIAADNTAERYSAFVIDTSSIETESAACQNVHQQYWWPLELGYVDPVEGLAEYQAKMEAAGIEKVREVIQAQLDAYVANMAK